MKFTVIENPEDLQIIRNIAADVWPKTFADILTPEQIRYMMQMMYSTDVMKKELQNGYFFEYLSIDAAPAGYISWSACDLPATAKLHKIYLLQKFHGKGIGSTMLAHVERRAKNAGFSRLILNVNKYNDKAKKAYLRNGFAVVDSVKIDIGNGFFMDDFVMTKEI